MDDKILNIFFDIHNNMPRQGPGSAASTKRAAELIDWPDSAELLDVGCGPGAQTFDLARLTNARITAVDFYDMYVQDVRQKIIKQKLSHRISVQQGDMNDLHFAPNSFDVIWSEGAIYIMGFEDGLTTWRPLLKPNGYIAVSEITWLRDDVPNDLQDYWLNEYPVKSIDDNIAIINRCGYQPIGYFSLPAQDWWENYYNYIEPRLPDFQDRYKDDPTGMQVIDMEIAEIEMFKKYSDYYSYVFYVMQKI